MSDSIANTSIEEEMAQANPENTDVIQGEASAEVSEGTTWRDILLADAPADDAKYQSHALNWDNQESTAKIIRGFEGITGNLNKAVLLIVMGVIQKVTEYQESEKEDKNPESEDLGAELEEEEI